MCAQILALLEKDANAVLVIESLERSGHQVITPTHFNAAISILNDRPVALIISEVHLQNGGNVFDFLVWVKRNPATRETPFVLFSFQPTQMAKYLEDGLRTTARLLGAAMYITMGKFDSDEFRKQIDSLLGVGDQAAIETGKS